MSFPKIISARSDEDATKYQKPDHDLNTIGDLFAALRSCWSPPPATEAETESPGEVAAGA